jgi:hypothetical protein
MKPRSYGGRMKWSRKTTAAATIVLASVALSPAHADESTANTLLTLYDRSGAADRVHIETLLIGAQRGMLVTSEWIESGRKQVPLYCKPKGLSLTGPQLVSILRDAIASDPALARADWGFSFLFALMRRFPCTKNSN